MYENKDVTEVTTGSKHNKRCVFSIEINVLLSLNIHIISWDFLLLRFSEFAAEKIDVVYNLFFVFL